MIHRSYDTWWRTGRYANDLHEGVVACDAIMSAEVSDDLLQLSDSDDEIEYEEEEGGKLYIKSLPEQIPVEILAKLSSANVEISGRCPWPGSLLLATYLNKNEYGKSLVTGKSVVELGTGCGILGFAIADLVSRLLLTDNDRFALSLVRKNIEQNFVEKSSVGGQVSLGRRYRFGKI